MDWTAFEIFKGENRGTTLQGVGKGRDQSIGGEKHKQKQQTRQARNSTASADNAAVAAALAVALAWYCCGGNEMK